MAADCAVDFRGNECGVAAIGRCLTCGKAFCMTHQARPNHTRYVDQCSVCIEASPPPPLRGGSYA